MSGVQYPSGCKEITDDLTPEELLKRLRVLYEKLKNEDESTNRYTALALSLAEENLTSHELPEVRALVSCCILDALRISRALDSPFNNDPEKIQLAFSLFVNELGGLSSSSPYSKIYFHLLETLNSCHAFASLLGSEESFIDLIATLFKTLLQAMNKTNMSIEGSCAEMMEFIIKKLEQVPLAVLDVLFHPLAVSRPNNSDSKSPEIGENARAKKPASDALPPDLRLVKRVVTATLNILQSSVEQVYGSILVSSTPRSPDDRFYAMLLGLARHEWSRSLVDGPIQHVHYRLKITETNERLLATRFVKELYKIDTLFVDKSREMWDAYYMRFSDVDPHIRMITMNSAQELLTANPDLWPRLSDALKARVHDLDEHVRQSALRVLASAACSKPALIRRDLIEMIVGRCLDKKFNVRREAFGGLGRLYKRAFPMGEQSTKSVTLDESTLQLIRIIPIRLFKSYAHLSVEDKMTIEKVFNASLIPFNMTNQSERMQRLYTVYMELEIGQDSKDSHQATFGFHAMLHAHKQMASFLRESLETNAKLVGDQQASPVLKDNFTRSLQNLARNLPFDSSSAASAYQERIGALMRVFSLLRDSSSLNKLLFQIISPECQLKDMDSLVTKFLGDVQTRFKPSKTDPQDVPMTFRVSKALIERTVPIIDRSSIAALLELIEKELESESQDSDASPSASSKGRRGARAKSALKSSLQSCSPEVQKKTRRALQLIEQLAINIPHPFANDEISKLILNNFVKSSNSNQTIRNLMCEYGLKILNLISSILTVELREELNSHLAGWTDLNFLNRSSPIAKQSLVCLSGLCDETARNVLLKDLTQKIRTALQKSKSASELLAPLKALGFCLNLISDPDWLSTQGRELVRREIIEGILARPPSDDYDEDECDATAWQHTPEARSKAGCFKVLRLMLENEKWLEAAVGTLEEKARLDQSQATLTLFASLLSQLDSESEARGDKSSKSKPTAMRIANALSPLCDGDLLYLRYVLATSTVRLTIRYRDGISNQHFLQTIFTILSSDSTLSERFGNKLAELMGTGASLSSLVPLEYLPVFSLVAPEDYDRNPSKYVREKVEEGGDTEDASMTWIRSARSALMQHIYFRRAVYQKYSSRLDSTDKLNEVLPEYSVVYLVYVLAHAPFYTSTNNSPQFTRVKRCIHWYLDPLVARPKESPSNDVDHITYMRKLLELVLSSEDALNPEYTERLHKVAGEAIQFLVSKGTQLGAVTIRGQYILPSRFFRPKKFSAKGESAAPATVDSVHKSSSSKSQSKSTDVQPTSPAVNASLVAPTAAQLAQSIATPGAIIGSPAVSSSPALEDSTMTSKDNKSGSQKLRAGRKAAAKTVSSIPNGHADSTQKERAGPSSPPISSKNSARSQSGDSRRISPTRKSPTDSAAAPSKVRKALPKITAYVDEQLGGAAGESETVAPESGTDSSPQATPQTADGSTTKKARKRALEDEEEVPIDGDDEDLSSEEFAKRRKLMRDKAVSDRAARAEQRLQRSPPPAQPRSARSSDKDSEKDETPEATVARRKPPTSRNKKLPASEEEEQEDSEVLKRTVKGAKRPAKTNVETSDKDQQEEADDGSTAPDSVASKRTVGAKSTWKPPARSAPKSKEKLDKARADEDLEADADVEQTPSDTATKRTGGSGKASATASAKQLGRPLESSSGKRPSKDEDEEDEEQEQTGDTDGAVPESAPPKPKVTSNKVPTKRPAPARPAVKATDEVPVRESVDEEQQEEEAGREEAPPSKKKTLAARAAKGRQPQPARSKKDKEEQTGAERAKSKARGGRREAPGDEAAAEEESVESARKKPAQIRSSFSGSSQESIQQDAADTTATSRKRGAGTTSSSSAAAAGGRAFRERKPVSYAALNTSGREESVSSSVSSSQRTSQSSTLNKGQKQQTFASSLVKKRAARAK